MYFCHSSVAIYKQCLPLQCLPWPISTSTPLSENISELLETQLLPRSLLCFPWRCFLNSPQRFWLRLRQRRDSCRAPSTRCWAKIAPMPRLVLSIHTHTHTQCKNSHGVCPGYRKPWVKHRPHLHISHLHSTFVICFDADEYETVCVAFQLLYTPIHTHSQSVT